MVRKDATATFSKETTTTTMFEPSSSNYRRLNQQDDGFIDAQFTQPNSKRIPWKAICFAILLFFGGTVLLVIGSLLVTGYIDEQYGDRSWPLIMLGALMFIPGSYHSYIAFYAYRGYAGFSFDDIPAYDDDYQD